MGRGLGGATVLQFGLPKSPLAQPRNVIAGATGLLAASADPIPDWQGFKFLLTALAGSSVMVLVALVFNNAVPGRRYPTFWYNGGEGQEPIAFLAGYEDPAALGWRYTGHDSRITAAYYENDSAPPGGAARKGPPPTTYHNRLSAKQWRDVLTSPPPPPEDEEDGAEALGEDELPFEFPRGYADPVDLDWEYVGSEPATRVAFYERREPGATIKLVFARPSKRSPPEHPPVYFRRLRAAAWRQVLADPRAHLQLGYVAEPPPPRRRQ
eukprot:XP_001697047.1 predicted protein [Chlamydomonas reinhardtii]